MSKVSSSLYSAAVQDRGGGRPDHGRAGSRVVIAGRADAPSERTLAGGLRAVGRWRSYVSQVFPMADAYHSRVFHGAV